MPTECSPVVGRSLGLHYQFGDQAQHLILPPEVLEVINEYIMGGKPNKPNYFGSVPAQLCRVNSTWNRIFTPALYAHYRFQGGINNLSSLYNLLHTLVRRPDLAAKVQELTLTTWDIHEEIQLEPRSLRQTFMLLWRYTNVFDRCWAIERLKQTDHDSLANRQAFESFCATCLKSDGSIKKKWKEPLKAAYAVAHDKVHWQWLDPVLDLVFGDLAWSAMVGLAGCKTRETGSLASVVQTPLTALIIALCPDLIRLNCDVWGMGEDPFFERIMSIATGSHPLPPIFRGKYRPMSKAESIQAAGTELVVNPTCPSPSRGRTSISDYKNYWNLPRLKSLTILNAEMTRDVKKIPSTIENLTIQGTNLQPHLTSLLSLTQNLRQLSLFLDVEYSSSLPADDDAHPMGPLQYAQTWMMLSHLKDQLEYLDLYQGAIGLFNTTTCTPPLRQLNIPLLGLYGYSCTHEPGTKFANHLPPALESLGLYAHAEDAPWSGQYFAPLDIELENIAVSACTSSPLIQNGKLKSNRNLRAIVGAEFQHKNKPYPFLQQPAAKMEAAAQKAGIFCTVAGDQHMVFCGLMSGWGFMNCPLLRGSFEVLDKMDPGRVIPRAMNVYGVRGRL